ncbi:hypothetical protein LCGC14_2028960 [marine sediment metagenome]|uniref:HNH domain-containing protein n=1 Tax=marine sediment metagenome TaxID=412755 RepID=A0A0F9H8P6_9ZZZZ
METLSGIKKICKRCGYTAPEEWFIKKGFTSKTHLQREYNICPMCQQESRDKKKWENRAINKAHRIIYSHTERYNTKHDTSLTSSRFSMMFGWEIKRMAHDINHTYDNLCWYCGHPFKDMGHGLADLSLDIINPDEEPFYTNVRYCCRTCNSSKGHRDNQHFGFHLAQVKARQEFINMMANVKPGTIRKPQFELELN